MTFKFSILCELFNRLETIQTDDKLPRPCDKAQPLRDATTRWFKSHATAIERLDVKDTTALLSALLSEWRKDRVYGLRSAGLSHFLARAMKLGHARKSALQAFKQPGAGDLGACVERVLTENGGHALPAISLIEVDQYLEAQAGRSPFSGRSIPSSSAAEREERLTDLMCRASPAEGKWLVRLLLKSLAPVEINEKLVLSSLHFLLPEILQFQQNFEAAISLLKGELRELPARPDVRSETLWREKAGSLLRPQVGIKVGRPYFVKCRGIDSCMKMVETRSWVVERKYDGEYCEIHIDLSVSPVPQECIKIFSKSGKESTVGRKNIHPILIECLRLGRADCRIEKQAIIVGELVAWSHQEQRVLPFEKIRKYVARSEKDHTRSNSVGTELDSQQHAHEHLAIVFFDLLLLDDEIILRRPVEERRRWLRETYEKKPGGAWSAEWKIVDFTNAKAGKKKLIEHFSRSIAQHWEGLILKPCGTPYFALGADARSHPPTIKLKKDYIDGLADEGDFAVIGASYDAQLAERKSLRDLHWTSFHLGCLTNKADVKRFDARPRFRCVYTLDCDACIPPPVLKTANTLGNFRRETYHVGRPLEHFDIDGTPKMDVAFNEPLVFEVIGSGFDKPSNQNYLMLRHARAKKMHEDRSWKDCLSFQELQEQAQIARAEPESLESQETRRYIEKLTRKHERKAEQKASSTTPSSRACTTPRLPPSDPTSSLSPADRLRLHVGLRDRQPSGPALSNGKSAGAPNRIVPSTVTPPIKRRRYPDEPDRRPERQPKLQKVIGKDEMVKLTSSTITNSSPLAEIKNCSSRALAKRTEMRPRTLKSGMSEVFRTCLLSTPDSDQSTTGARHVSSSKICRDSRCPFAKTTVFLSACIANQLYVGNDLLPCHDAILTISLDHWDRDSFAHAAGTDTVSESQSHEGMRKIILVEIRRISAVSDLVRKVRLLNGGCFRERVELYDWRVLEHCQDHGTTADFLKQHFVGATMFDDTQKRTLFVSSYPGLNM